MDTRELVPTELDRVRAHTAHEINERIDRQIERNIEYFSTQPTEVISARLLELEREWDMERLLETNASAVAFSGCVLTALVSKRWILLPLTVTAFLFQHAVQGWCPPVPVFRRLGVRTRSEIDAEKYALKALRGDFDELKNDADMHSRANKAVEAVKERYSAPPKMDS
jgi:hypothetical protein